MHATLRILCIAVLALFFSDAALAQDLSISMTTQTGILFGLAKELVYDNGYLLSELDWGIQPVEYAGVALDMEAPAGLTASLSLKAGFPSRSGYVTDSDFMNGNGVKTHFSQHESHTERAMFIDGRFGWRFPLYLSTSFALTLGILGELDAMLYKWSARNGYLQYPPESSAPYTPWTASTAQISVYGTGIIYEQDYIDPALGLEAVISAANGFSTTLFFSAFPYAWCFDVDNHVFRQLDFYENMAGGMFFDGGFSAGFRIGARSLLEISVSYRHIMGLIGDSYYITTGVGDGAGAQSAPSPDGGGAAYDAVDISASFAIRL